MFQQQQHTWTCGNFVWLDPFRPSLSGWVMEHHQTTRSCSKPGSIWSSCRSGINLQTWFAAGQPSCRFLLNCPSAYKLWPWRIMSMAAASRAINSWMICTLLIRDQLCLTRRGLFSSNDGFRPSVAPEQKTWQWRKTDRQTDNWCCN